MVEWLYSGLQIRGRRFDSGLSLHNFSLMTVICPGGEIGRRKGLKIPRWRHRAGSIPALGTIDLKAPFRKGLFLCLFIIPNKRFRRNSF